MSSNFLAPNINNYFDNSLHAKGLVIYISDTKSNFNIFLSSKPILNNKILGCKPQVNEEKNALNVLHFLTPAITI